MGGGEYTESGGKLESGRRGGEYTESGGKLESVRRGVHREWR